MGLDDLRNGAHHDGVDFGGAVKNELRNQDRNQEWLAMTLGVDRATVSRLLAGQRSASLDEVVKIAQALKVEPGELLRAAGYVKVETSTEKMISSDPNLDAAARRVLLAAYREASRRR